jgi:hypothetical protein
VIPSTKAVSLGLIVTELVINALKYAFPKQKADALILVTYEIDALDWKLIVSDNGVGKDAVASLAFDPGLGTTIVKALSKQLGARMDLFSGPTGLTVSVTRATFTSRMPQADRPIQPKAACEPQHFIACGPRSRIRALRVRGSYLSVMGSFVRRHIRRESQSAFGRLQFRYPG